MEENTPDFFCSQPVFIKILRIIFSLALFLTLFAAVTEPTYSVPLCVNVRKFSCLYKANKQPLTARGQGSLHYGSLKFTYHMTLTFNITAF